MFTAPSYAKINLFLHVLGKRPDGYHDIYTLFCGISLHDTLTIAPSGKLMLESTGISMPLDTNNIICRVDSILRDEYGLKDFYKVHVHKRIPVGAGLAGGSSNACVYLQLVNKASKMGLPLEEMAKILSRVGSDTPFFLYLPAALGEGRGELLTPVENGAKLPLILINPGIFVSTPSVYNDEKLQLTNTADLPKIFTFYDVDQAAALMSNGMQEAVFARHPLLQGLCGDLEANGAVKAMMSGSGSTVFGVFRDEAVQTAAYDVLQSKYRNYTVVKAVTL